MFMVFDLLHLDGEDVYRLPWWQRWARLDALGIESSCWQVPRYWPADDLTAVYEATNRLGLEGIVLKRTPPPTNPAVAVRLGST